MTERESSTIRIDVRALLPVLVLAFIVLVIIFVELCGKTDVEPFEPSGTPIPVGPTSTVGPTATTGPTSTPDPAQGTATQESATAGADRDEIRQADLNSIASALEEYLAENGNYPSTEDGIQTVCTFEDDDEGCALREFLNPIPSDPLGNPGTNGYWLQSTDDTFTIFAQRESDLFEACDDKPAHLEDFGSVFCIRNQ
jgi:hypothetical protein